MKYMCIAAVALAGATLSSAPARADASNCSYFNGPYCELAHAVRHHGWRPPIVWATPAIPLAGPVISYPLHQPFGGYPVPYPYWGNQVGCAVTPVPRNPCGYATPYSVTAW